MKSLITNFPFIVLLLLGLLSFQTSQSQILISLLLGDKLNSPNLEFGIDGGYNRSYLSGISESKGMGNFHLGFYFDIRIKNDLWFNTGVRVKSNVGATKLSAYSLNDPDLDTVFYMGHVTRKIGYFYVPVHLKYRFTKNKQFFVNIGGQIGLRSKANDIFQNTYFEKNDVNFVYDIGDYIKRIDAGLSGGFGYKFKGTGMNLGITYYHGLMDITKPTPLEPYNIFSRNSTFYIYVSIPVGAGYKEAKQNTGNDKQ